MATVTGASSFPPIVQGETWTYTFVTGAMEFSGYSFKGQLRKSANSSEAFDFTISGTFGTYPFGVTMHGTGSAICPVGECVIGWHAMQGETTMSFNPFNTILVIPGVVR